jgi:7-cyano-7-deazaguanine synthase
MRARKPLRVRRGRYGRAITKPAATTEGLKRLHTVLLSGGMDSATALAMLRRASGAHIEALFVDLGQLARREECTGARELADHFDVTLRELSVSGLASGVGEIPGRNLLLVSTALTVRAGLPGTIVLGIHAGTGYFDCGEQFLGSVQRLIDGYHGGGVQLSAPFLHMNKGEVARLAEAHEVPLALTYSCERADGPCGMCASCGDRLRIDAAAA